MALIRSLGFLIFATTLLALYYCVANISAADMSSSFQTMSAPDLVQYSSDGQEILLSLDQKNASGFSSGKDYLYGYFNMRIKLVSGDSAGTVTTYYFSSLGDFHDELDFEFLGNTSGQPIILQTNVYASGVGGREQRIFLWFDPTADFHNYTLLWNPYQVVFFVDGIPIRVYPNIEAETGVPFLHNQTMKVYATIWDGDSWATQGGLVKINWSHAPFTASYREFAADGCTNIDATLALECASPKWWNEYSNRALNYAQLGQLQWVKDNYTIYDYCTDTKRYNVTPPECLHNTPISLGSAVAPSSPSIGLPGTFSTSSPAPSPIESSAPSSLKFDMFISSTILLLLIPLLHPYA